MPVIDDSNQTVIRLPDCQKDFGGNIAFFVLNSQTVPESNPLLKGSTVFQTGTSIEFISILL